MSLHMEYASQPDNPKRACCILDRPCQVCLLTCLRQYMSVIDARLSRSFPGFIVQQAVEIAENTAIDAICDGTAARMSGMARRRWLYVIAYRQAVTLIRRPRPSSLIEDLIRAPEAYLRHAEIRQAVAALPAGLHEVIEMIYFEGCKRGTVARRLNINRGTVQRRHETAICLLKKMLTSLE